METWNISDRGRWQWNKWRGRIFNIGQFKRYITTCETISNQPKNEIPNQIINEAEFKVELSRAAARSRLGPLSREVTVDWQWSGIRLLRSVVGGPWPLLAPLATVVRSAPQSDPTVLCSEGQHSLRLFLILLPCEDGVQCLAGEMLRTHGHESTCACPGWSLRGGLGLA